jgi:7-cyano-7-deazaguanine synthase in queuosine biosynthesis
MEIITGSKTTDSRLEEGTSVTHEQSSKRARTARSDGRKIRSLVMWSGGLDSTYALARLLEETADEVYAHHIRLNAPRDDATSRSRRCEFEAQAISRLVVPLKSRFRDFEYSESRADLTAFPCFARDATTAMFFAAQLAMSRGFTPFDRILVGVDDEDPRWRPGTELYALRRMLMNRILRAVWESEEIPYLYVFYPRPSRADAFEYLGQELAPLTVSCRHPEAGGLGFRDDALRPCNACPKCRSRAKLEQDADDEAAA